MMALWMAYAAAVSLLFAGAALAAEKALELYRKPTRWPWVVALAGSVLVPLGVYAASSGWLGSGGDALAGALSRRAVGTGTLVPEVFPGAEATTGSSGGLGVALRSLDPWLAGGCLVASIAAAGWLAVGWLRLRAEHREWRSATMGGVTVLISPGEGPAVTGFLRGKILLPTWFQDLDRKLQQLVLRHEREHLRGGDHRLFGVGLAALVVLPWNPVLWWCLSRLRQAMEIDCDRRVLAHGVSPATYGELLVQAGRRASGSMLSPASFASSESLLERRVKKLATAGGDGPVPPAAFSALAVVLVVTAGGWLPSPEDPVHLTRGDVSPRVAHRTDRAQEPRVVPPVPAAMRFDVRMYLKREADGATSGEAEREIDIEAVRMARRLSFGCAPYLTGSVGAAGDAGRPGGPGCLVVMDGRRVEPSALRELGSGAIERIHILPADEATERYGSDGSRGAFLIETEQG